MCLPALNSYEYMDMLLKPPLIVFISDVISRVTAFPISSDKRCLEVQYFPHGLHIHFTLA